MDLPAPSVPEDRLASRGYERRADRSETLADLGVARAVGRTVVYERGQGFFFATRVGLEPGLPRGGSLVAPTVFAAADRAFRADLRERDASDIDVRDTGRLRVETGERARMRRYAVEIAGRAVAAALCCWPREPGFRVSGGAAPASELDDVLELVRGVE